MVCQARLLPHGLQQVLGRESDGIGELILIILHKLCDISQPAVHLGGGGGGGSEEVRGRGGGRGGGEEGKRERCAHIRPAPQ